MRDWISGIAGEQYATAILWTLGALLVLAVLLFVVRQVRGMNTGTFVAGGRNRRPRLAVMDATAVDTHRRLVLVRRDEVEHLILIGGPTDVVVEQNIRVAPAARRPANPIQPDSDLDDLVRPTPEPRAPAAPAPAPASLPRPPEMLPPRLPEARPEPPMAAQAPTPSRPPAPAVETRRPVEPRPPQPAPSASPRPVAPPVQAAPVRTPPPLQPAPAVASPPPRPAPAQPVRPPPVQAPARPVQQAAPPRPAPEPEDIDDALLDELEISIDEAEKSERKPVSLDDEMTRLLGELSGRNRR